MANLFNTAIQKLRKNIRPQGNYVLNAYNGLKNIPGGLTLLSKIVSRKAPYFQTVDPIIRKLERNYCEASMSKNKTVENHIGTVHVIAICNGLEYVMGVLAEASVPAHLRWLPKGMQVDYLAKADSDIRLTAIVEQDWKTGDLQVKVQALREDGVVVVQGIITLWVTEKK
ncbi:DUF4442 domain-containing protein [Acinetobacter sp. NIPH 1852]|uniref:hotdog fold domain-containing protein n=1 Tax=Acinetobacter sp. NIPH 1852 TaxID=2923428 RepID=UPI001F4B230C|nr:hotdog fold domain-containing protein [Acinetobacter sp. NIPH 1852]MCH7307447.1 DUF4442 domain-containing protein [Acinetobacter sp. NIPH 1852]